MKQEVWLLNDGGYSGLVEVDFPVLVVAESWGSGWEVSGREIISIGGKKGVFDEGVLYYFTCEEVRSELPKSEEREINRVEVIDHRSSPNNKGVEWIEGRNIIVSPTDEGTSVVVEFQDNGKTLKVFLSDKEGGE